MNPATWKRMGRGAGSALPLGLILVLVVGCGPSKMAKDQLEIARKTYMQAKSDPKVEILAPIHLADAETALLQAERAGNSTDMFHRGHLAEKKTRIAMTVAEGRQAGKEIERVNRGGA